MLTLKRRAGTAKKVAAKPKKKVAVTQKSRAEKLCVAKGACRAKASCARCQHSGLSLSEEPGPGRLRRAWDATIGFPRRLMQFLIETILVVSFLAALFPAISSFAKDWTETHKGSDAIGGSFLKSIDLSHVVNLAFLSELLLRSRIGAAMPANASVLPSVSAAPAGSSHAQKPVDTPQLKGSQVAQSSRQGPTTERVKNPFV